MSERLHVIPMTLREARKYVDRHHRHHRAPQGGLFAIGIAAADSVRGVAIIGRPVSRMMSDGYTAEVTRVCTDGVKNGCSMLYGAAWRAARALGYRKLITYTLKEEGGGSLRGAGWRCVGAAGGGTWSRKSRPRVDLHPQQIKLRWEVSQ